MLVRLLFIFLVWAASGAAYAADPLGRAFESLLSGGNASLTEPGRVSTSVRGAVGLGGLSVRFPRSSERVQLFSITPPGIKAGCGGIDLHLGGFSYVSGEEIERLMKAISQSARGMIIQLVITKLCPQCASVLSDLVDRVQKATMFAFDSCNIVQNAMNAVGLDPSNTSSQQKKDSTKGFCAQGKAEDGESDSLLSSLSKSCNDALQSLEWVRNKINAASAALNAPQDVKNDVATAKRNEVTGEGNAVWLTLKRDFIRGNDDASIGARLLLMNLVGFSIVHAEQETVVVDEYPSPLGGGQDIGPLFTLFMCGAPAAAQQLPPQVRWYCSSYGNNGAAAASLASLSIYDCFLNGSQTGNARYDECKEVGPGPLPLDEVPVLRDMTGFLPSVHGLMQEGITRVRSNTPLINGEGDTVGKQLVHLMQSVPYPLYQAINVAAVYPAAAEDLVASMSVLVAEQLVYQYIDAFLDARAVPKVPSATRKADYEAIYKVMGLLRNQAQARMQLVAQHWTLQQAIAEQIRSLNQAIQRQVLSEDMLGAARYAATVNRSASGGGSN